MLLENNIGLLCSNKILTIVIDTFLDVFWAPIIVVVDKFAAFSYKKCRWMVKFLRNHPLIFDKNHKISPISRPAPY